MATLFCHFSRSHIHRQAVNAIRALSNKKWVRILAVCETRWLSRGRALTSVFREFIILLK